MSTQHLQSGEPDNVTVGDGQNMEDQRHEICGVIAPLPPGLANHQQGRLGEGLGAPGLIAAYAYSAVIYTL
jgi:hypothetical protein